MTRRLAALAAIALVWSLALAAWFATRARPVAIGAALDLTITSGAIAYWLGVRGRTLAAIVVAGALAAKVAVGSVLVVAIALEEDRAVARARARRRGRVHRAS